MTVIKASSSDIKAVREYRASRPDREGLSIAETRQIDEEAVADLPLPEGATVEQVEDASVKGEWVRTAAARQDTVLLYLHGGAYVFCSPRTHRHLVAALGEAAGVAAFTLDYRLAPESPFPAAVEDAAAAYRWLLEQGFAPNRIAVAGDSAGGGLTMAMLVAARDAGLPMPAAAVCLSPWADLTIMAESFVTKASVDSLTGDRLRRLGQLYLNGADNKHPLASPFFADLHNLPPLLIQVGTDEVLFDDSIHLEAAAKAAGVETQLEIWEEMIHVWHYYHPMLSEGRKAIARIGEFVKAWIGRDCDGS
jgi:monoterpene epsilon-lactone hydrolase